MELKRALPAGRNLDQIMNHYKVEKALADKLKSATREERTHIYSTMYDELFSQVPDHPRLTRRQSTTLSQHANKVKHASVKPFINKDTTLVEFAPGDCKFIISISEQIKTAYGVDISDQTTKQETPPENFELIVYDGYNLDVLPDESIDIVFSDQLIEHLHPEDTELHFKLVHRILKKGGKYIFRTPHALTGPHDVSQFFSDEPECFHLKEWYYSDIKQLLDTLKYSNIQTRWNAKGIDFRMPYNYFKYMEKIFSLFPKKNMRLLTRYFIPSVCVVAVK